MSPFYQAVYDLVRQIPPGKVASYGQLAFLAGRPRAARQAGQAMAHCPPDLPWHRVVSRKYIRGSCGRKGCLFCRTGGWTLPAAGGKGRKGKGKSDSRRRSRNCG